MTRPATTSRYPTGLFFLFATEMWERFSFYGISAVLVLYLTTGLGLPDAQAGLASGAYMAFTFMTPHVSGKPMIINDIGHLRQVERDYGVVLTAFSNEPSNGSDGPMQDLPRYRGDDIKRRGR